MKRYLLILFFASCVPQKEIVYFQSNDNKSPIKVEYKPLIFKSNDILTITVNSSDVESVKPFNILSSSYGISNSTVTETSTKHRYLVDENGFIEFPILGKIKVGGLNKSQVIFSLKKMLDPEYVKNPSINIEILNFRISVLGDVRLPGSYKVQNEKITILEAISLAGDLNISGVREIEIKRTIGGEIYTGFLDLKSNDLFKSPYFYLQQNDIIYVKPNKAQSQNAAFNKNNGVLVSIASILITLIAVLTR